MSLARSASGPPGLSINTGAANTLGSSSLQPPAAGGLFGSSTTSTPTTTSTAPTTGGMFGATQQQKPAGLGLFAQPATTGTTTAGGGLFGGGMANTQQNQGTTGTGLFGAANTNQTQQQQQQQTPSTGLFGQSTQQNQQQPAAGMGLFGNTNTQQNQPQNTFGASITQNQQPQQQGGIFLQSTANTQSNTGTGLFGQSQAKPSGGLFGQPQTQQMNTPGLGQSTNQVSAVQINYDNIRPRTRFDDLAKPVQDEIALLDKGIQRVIKMKDEIGEFMPQHERDIEQLGRDVKFVESKFKTVQVALNSDIQTVKVLQDMTKKNIADAQLSFKATDNLKLPTHYHQTGLFASTPPASDSNSADAASTHSNAQDLITYFNRICDDIEKYKKRLDEYRGAIERDMPGVENGLYDQIRALQQRSSGNAVVQDQLGEVLAALRDTGNAIIAKAGQIAETRERLARLQAGILDSGVYTMGLAS